MRNFLLAIIAVQAIMILLPASVKGQLIRDPAVLENMKESLIKQKELAAGRNHQLFDVFNRPMKPDDKMALEYLYAYMPLSDLADYSGEYFEEQVSATMKAREEMPWGYKIPEDIFLHFVLPVRINNENLDNFRSQMYDEIKDRIKGLSMHDAALEINHWCHEKVTYKGSDERTSSPLASIRTSFGRCGEESTFTVASMRTAGIPARQVYTPRWAHSDDNHAWVEVWVDGSWYFLGACEPDADLNMGWFAAPAMRAMLVHTRAYGWYNGHEPVIDRQDKFSELNEIRNYAETKTIFVKVLDEKNQIMPGVKVEYQLYNYAEFYPIAKGKTDKSGLSSITTGLGDLLIWATNETAWGYKKITVENTDTVSIVITTNHPANATEILDIIPPIEKAPPVTNATPESIQLNSKRLQVEDSIRSAYMSTFKGRDWALAFAEKLNLDPEQTVEFFRLSYGNWMEISSFLESVQVAERPWAMNLLNSISEKDIRDTKAVILHDHLENSLSNLDGIIPSDTALFSNYIMSGRIANEMMLPWRGFLQQQFTKEFKNSVKGDINVLIKWIRENIRIDDISNMHSRAPLSPRGVYELKVADSRSRDIFFVAVSRCFGIASRMNPATNIPQVWKNGNWENIVFDPASEDISKKGNIHFVNGNPAIDPKYAINFTIARFSKGVYRSVDFDYGKLLSEFPASIEIEAGHYYLVTGNRQADGSVLSSLSFFDVPEGKTTEIKVTTRESKSRTEPWGKVNLASFSLENYLNGKKETAAGISGAAGVLLIWIDPDKEPSKHVMADLPAVKGLLDKWDGEVVFLLQKDKLTKSFNPENFKNLPARTTYVYDLNSRFIQEISKMKGHELVKNLPVVIVSDKQGNMYYFSEGYKIGIGEQIAKVVNRMK